MDAVLALTRIALGLLLIYAAVAKSSARLRFEQTLYGFGLVPISMVRPLSYAVPVTELFLGIVMMLGLYSRVAAVATGILIGIFTIGVTINLVEGRRVECGCFGETGSRTISNLTLLRNAALVAACLLLAIFGGGAWQLGPD